VVEEGALDCSCPSKGRLNRPKAGAVMRGGAVEERAASALALFPPSGRCRHHANGLLGLQGRLDEMKLHRTRQWDASGSPSGGVIFAGED